MTNGSFEPITHLFSAVRLLHHLVLEDDLLNRSKRGSRTHNLISVFVQRGATNASIALKALEVELVGDDSWRIPDQVRLTVAISPRIVQLHQTRERPQKDADDDEIAFGDDGAGLLRDACSKVEMVEPAVVLEGQLGWPWPALVAPRIEQAAAAKHFLKPTTTRDPTRKQFFFFEK